MLHELIPDEEHSVPTRQGGVHAHEPASEVDERVDVHPGLEERADSGDQHYPQKWTFDLKQEIGSS